MQKVIFFDEYVSARSVPQPLHIDDYFNTSIWKARAAVVSGWCSLQRNYALNTARVYLYSQKPMAHDVIIYDIHDTLLDVSTTLLFLYDKPTTNHLKHIMNQQLNPLVAVRDFYDEMYAAGYTPLILTAGVAYKRDFYEALIEHAGYRHYALFCMRPVDKSYLTKAKNKENTRLFLIRHGYRISALVGDQWGDVIGAHAGLACKLPNIFYTSF